MTQPAPHKKAKLSQYTSWLSKSRQNLFSLDGYMSGELLMIDDTVSISRAFRTPMRGEIADLHYEHKSFQLLAAQVAVRDKLHRVGPARLTHVRRRESYREHWRKVHGDLEYYRDRLRRDPMTELDEHDYERIDFDAGLGLLRLGDHWELARRFFERAILKANRRLETELSSAEAPVQRVHDLDSAVRCKVYAGALLDGQVDSVLLLEAARVLEAYCADVEGGHWDAFYQDLYLSAVRMAMLGGDLEFARELLRSERSFRWHKDQRDLLKKLVRKSVRPAEDADLVRRCHAFLDFVRRPHASRCVSFMSLWTGLEWAILVETLVNEVERPDWRAVVTHLYR